MNRLKLEICAATPQSVINAVEGGADRVELCSALSEGGVTPSSALVSFAAKRIDTHVLIRPRRGDFLYSDAEKEVMLGDILEALRLGAKGIAVGALTADGQIDTTFMQRVMEAAGGMSVTFHRAFDMVCDASRALEEVTALGCRRVLTSGGAPSAEQGLPRLCKLAHQAGSRVIIMPAGGVCPENVQAVMRQTGTCEVHASASRQVDSKMLWRGGRASMGNPEADEYSWTETSLSTVRRLREAIDALH